MRKTLPIHPRSLLAALGMAMVAGALSAQQPGTLADADTSATPAASGVVRPSRAVAMPGTAALRRAAEVREAARVARGRRLIVSLEERRLWSMDNGDTLYSAPIAVGKGTRLEYGRTVWDFTTPAGVRRVRRKAPNPVWVPPDWHYVELARDSSWTVARLERGRPTRLPDGTRLEVRGERIARVHPGGRAELLPADEEVIFGDTIFIPPLGTANRSVEGELGKYKLELGDGYMIHGTRHQDSIGQAATHGCIRMTDADISYIYHTVPGGIPVYIY
jgi:lipoprotein-anchoring transpeptidase ErfK/SrfK